MDCKCVLLFVLLQCVIIAAVFAAEEQESASRSSHFITQKNKQLISHVAKQFESPSLLSCGQQCMRNAWCTSTNFQLSSKKDEKGICELNKGEISLINENNDFHKHEGVVFSMRLEGCLMTGCLSGGSCLFNDNKQTFSCSCKLPWTGNRCEVKLGPECSSYSVDAQEDRSASFPKAIRKCDDRLVSGWYRFNSTAGSTIPTYCVQKEMCNADSPGWLNGTHPTPQEGVVNRTVCFNWGGNCCNWRVTVSVRNCGSFYVYQLERPPLCHLRYCVTN